MITTLDGARLAGTLSWGKEDLDLNSVVASFVPSSALADSTDYFVRISLPKAFKPLWVFDFTTPGTDDGDYRATFSTASKLRIQWVKFDTPKNDNSTYGKMRIRFSEAIDTKTAANVFSAQAQGSGFAGAVTDPPMLASAQNVRELEYTFQKPFAATDNVMIQLDDLRSKTGAAMDYSAYVNGADILGPAKFSFGLSSIARLDGAATKYWRPPVPTAP